MWLQLATMLRLCDTMIQVQPRKDPCKQTITGLYYSFSCGKGVANLQNHRISYCCCLQQCRRRDQRSCFDAIHADVLASEAS